MARVVRFVELLAGLLLLYFAVSINPAAHIILFVLFVIEAVAALYLAIRFGRHRRTRTVAFLLAIVVLTPMAWRLAAGAYNLAAPAGSGTLIALGLSGLLAATQVVGLVGVLLYREAPARSA